MSGDSVRVSPPGRWWEKVSSGSTLCVASASRVVPGGLPAVGVPAGGAPVASSSDRWCQVRLHLGACCTDELADSGSSQAVVALTGIQTYITELLHTAALHRDPEPVFGGNPSSRRQPAPASSGSSDRIPDLGGNAEAASLGVSASLLACGAPPGGSVPPPPVPGESAPPDDGLGHERRHAALITKLHEDAAERATRLTKRQVEARERGLRGSAEPVKRFIRTHLHNPVPRGNVASASSVRVLADGEGDALKPAEL